jgi:hypothetical protein
MPYALKPPIAATDLTTRVHIIEPREAYCCWYFGTWERHVRQTVSDFQAGPARPIRLLRWDESSRLVERTEPANGAELRPLVSELLVASSDEALAQAMERLLAANRR